MIDFKYKYDICVISFSDINYDARTINLIRTCINLNMQVVLISLYSDSTVQFEKNFHHIKLITPPNRRMFIKWSYFLFKAKKIIKNINANVYWASDLYSLLVAKYIKNKRIIYDSREIYSALSTLVNNSIKQRVITYIEERMLKYVNNIVVSGELDSEYLKKIYNLKIPIDIIYNYPNFHPHIKSNLIRHKYSIANDKTILIYQGVLLDGRGIVPIFNAIKKTNDFVFIILGEGTYKNELVNTANSLNISDKVVFTGNINYEELHKWTCSADIGLCNIEPISFSYELALPNKLFEYIQAGLPVLATDLPALKDIIEKHKCGIVIPKENNPDDILNALYEIKQNYDFLIKNVHNTAEKFYYETQTELIKNIIMN